MRALRSLILVALLLVPATVLAGTGDAGSRAVALRAEGAVSLTNSRGNDAIFTASALGPGGSAKGRVAIRNTGTRPAQLALSQSDVQDALGPSGGRLSSRLVLTVRDLTTGRTVYSGPFASMPRRDAGLMLPGWSRTYELTATLPRSGGNAFQGSSASVRYVWTATETTLPAPARPAPAPPPAPGHCVPALSVPGGQPLLRRRRMVALVRVSRACRVTVRGFVTTRSGRRRFVYGSRRWVAGDRTHRIQLRLARAVRKILRGRSRRKRFVLVHVTTGEAEASARVRVR